jgi:hypothetical protein
MKTVATERKAAISSLQTDLDTLTKRESEVRANIIELSKVDEDLARRIGGIVSLARSRRAIETTFCSSLAPCSASSARLH